MKKGIVIFAIVMLVACLFCSCDNEPKKEANFAIINKTGEVLTYAVMNAGDIPTVGDYKSLPVDGVYSAMIDHKEYDFYFSTATCSEITDNYNFTNFFLNYFIEEEGSTLVANPIAFL